MRRSEAAHPRGAVLASIAAATFTDLMAYSVAVPVLPAYAERFDASPTTIGMLFGSFGVTLLVFSIPMGAVSDRIGRKGPMLTALALLALSTAIFAYARTLPELFVARMLQGAADAVTWVVGFALITDLYSPAERGWPMGLVMSGASLGVILGPSAGGWLYEIGGIRLPFLVVAALAILDFAVFAAVAPRTRGSGSSVPMRDLLAQRPILVCVAAVVVGAATIAMLEPVLALFFETRLTLGPAAIGSLFGGAALVSAMIHPLYGRLSDRWGGRRLMLLGLVLSAILLPTMAFSTDLRSAALAMVPLWAALSLIVTPSLAFVAEAAAAAGVESYGMVYGVYNAAWAVGLMMGPSIGGWLFERVAFAPLMQAWAAMLLIASLILARIR